MRDYQKDQALLIIAVVFVVLCWLIFFFLGAFLSCLTFLIPQNFACGAEITKNPFLVFVPLISANFRIFWASFSYSSLTENKTWPTVQNFKRLSGNFSVKILENKNVEQIALLGTKFQFQVSVHVFCLRSFIFGARAFFDGLKVENWKIFSRRKPWLCLLVQKTLIFQITRK